MKIGSSLRRLGVAIVLTSFTPLALVHGELAASKYRGFTIDESRIRNNDGLEAIRTATKGQIDMVFSVGLPVEILTLFQSVPFELVPTGAIRRGSPGLYGGKERSVKVVSAIVAVGHKPVLLHELLHAYHDQQIKDGFRNRTILLHFERAKALGAYAAKSHMMQNGGEFFACAATAYLFGVTAQEPFSRDKIKASQPDFFAYLQTLFGPNAGSYAGSLTHRN